MAIRALAVLVTTHCNLRCTYCPLHPPRRHTSSWPVLRGALDRLLPEAGDEVAVLFTGGEPLVALPLVKQAVAYLDDTQADRRRVRWEMITNGLLLNGEAVHFLDEHAFDLTVSFDGVREAQAGRRRGSFERLDRLLRQLRRARPSFFERLTIAITVTPAAVTHLARSVAYFASLGITHLTVKPAAPGVGWEPGLIRDLEAQWTALGEAARIHHERTGHQALSLFPEEPPNGRSDPGDVICGAASGESVTVDVDGRAYGCVVAAASYQAAAGPALRDALDSLALGPVEAPEFHQRLASMPGRARACGAFTHPEERYSNYRRCRDCEYLARCHACPLAGALDPRWDDARRVPDFVCAWNQVTLAHRDRHSIRRAGA